MCGGGEVREGGRRGGEGRMEEGGGCGLWRACRMANIQDPVAVPLSQPLRSSPSRLPADHSENVQPQISYCSAAGHPFHGAKAASLSTLQPGPAQRASACSHARPSAMYAATVHRLVSSGRARNAATTSAATSVEPPAWNRRSSSKLEMKRKLPRSACELSLTAYTPPRRSSRAAREGHPRSTFSHSLSSLGP